MSIAPLTAVPEAVTVYCSTEDAALFGHLDRLLLALPERNLDPERVRWIQTDRGGPSRVTIGEETIPITYPRTQNELETIGIDYNSIIRNGAELTTAVVPHLPRLVAKILQIVVGASLGFLGIFGTKQAVRLVSGQGSACVAAIRNKDLEGAVLSGILAAAGVGYACAALSAGIVGGAVLAHFIAHVAAPVLLLTVLASVFLIAGTALYAGVALYSLIKLVKDLHFHFQLKAALRQGNDQALEFLFNKSPEELARRTSAYFAARLSTCQDETEEEELLKEALRANSMEIVGDLLLLLVGALGIAAFLLSGPAGYALFIVVGILWLCAMDDSKLTARIRLAFYNQFVRQNQIPHNV
jgi:hypothetical protein